MRDKDQPDRVREVSPAYGLPTHGLTYSDYCRLPDDHRYELIEGDISVTPSPVTVHQSLSLEIATILVAWAKGSGLGRAFIAPFDVVLSDRTVVQPDVLYVSRERSQIITRANIQGAPDLVVEVLSSTREDWDRIVKRDVYSRYGVREYWLVDPGLMTIEVFARDGDGLRTIEVCGAGGILKSLVLPGFSLDVGRLFADCQLDQGLVGTKSPGRPRGAG